MEDTGSTTASIINSVDLSGHLGSVQEMLVANAPLVVGIFATFAVIYLAKKLIFGAK